MAKINVNMDRISLANHRRSFNFQRANFLNGKPADNKVVPTRWVADKYETFDQYFTDITSRLAVLFNERLSLFIPQEQREVDITLSTTPGRSYRTAAIYYGVNDNSGNIDFTFKLDDLLYAFYYPLKETRIQEENTVKATTDHEIRHHLDRNFVNSSRFWNAVLEQRKTTYGNYSSQNLLNDYLRQLRTEGFAEFSLDLRPPVSIELERQTQITAEGIQKLCGQESIKWVDWYDYCKDTGFDAYEQGKTIFQVIALAERMRLEGFDSAPLGAVLAQNMPVSESLFVMPKNYPEYLKILNKIASIPTYMDFISYYDGCASYLQLGAGERIITPDVADRLTLMGNATSLADRLVQVIFPLGDKK